MILLELLFMKDLMILLVLLLIFPTLDSHSNSFVSTAWPNEFASLTVHAIANDFTSRTVNLLHSWLSLLLICIYCQTKWFY